MTLKNMTRGKIVLASVLAIMIAAPFAATAHGKGRDGPRVTFEQLDADGNGQVTQAELAARAKARFDGADADGDGVLSLEELTAKSQERAGERGAKHAEKMFERRDANADGKLSPDELAPPADRVAKRFERADSDQSGGISKEEFEAAMKDGRAHRRGDK